MLKPKIGDTIVIYCKNHKELLIEYRNTHITVVVQGKTLNEYNLYDSKSDRLYIMSLDVNDYDGEYEFYYFI